NRFFVTAPNQGESLTAGSSYKIAWKTLGKVAKVNLEYSTGGAWKSVADSAANTGSYDWKVPADVTDKLRVRVSGPSWAFEDSSDGMNAITNSTGVNRSVTPRAVAFRVAGRGTVATGAPGA